MVFVAIPQANQLRQGSSSLEQPDRRSSPPHMLVIFSPMKLRLPHPPKPPDPPDPPDPHSPMKVLSIAQRDSSLKSPSLCYRDPISDSFFFSSLGKVYVSCFRWIGSSLEADEFSRLRHAVRSDLFSGYLRRSLSPSPGSRLSFPRFKTRTSIRQSLTSAGSSPTRSLCHRLSPASLFTGESPPHPVMSISYVREASLIGNPAVKPQSTSHHSQPRQSGQTVNQGLNLKLHKMGLVPILSPISSTSFAFHQTSKGASHTVLYHKAFSPSSLAWERSFPSSSLLWERTFQSFFVYRKRLVSSSSCNGEGYFNSFTVLLSFSKDASGFAFGAISISKNWFSKSPYNVISSIEFGSTVNLISTHLNIVSSSLSFSFEKLSLLTFLIFKAYCCNQRGWIIPSVCCMFEV